MARAYNFSAGPATLPEPVLRQAQEEMLDWHGAGASIVELSHRSSEFIGVAARAEADLRALLSVPQDYAVLFLAGGATTQQALLPLNFAAPGQVVVSLQSLCPMIVGSVLSKKKVLASGSTRCGLPFQAISSVNALNAAGLGVVEV